MIQFQEDQLGKVAKEPKFVRLPVRHFLDFTPDGPLCHILATMHQFKNEQGWRRFEDELRAKLADQQTSPSLYGGWLVGLGVFMIVTTSYSIAADPNQVAQRLNDFLLR